MYLFPLCNVWGWLCVSCKILHVAAFQSYIPPPFFDFFVCLLFICVCARARDRPLVFFFWFCCVCVCCVCVCVCVLGTDLKSFFVFFCRLRLTCRLLLPLLGHCPRHLVPFRSSKYGLLSDDKPYSGCQCSR